jgi:uncharacterized protein YsxB (DUF464 family)
MITATIFEKKGRITGYEISGHANSGDYGHDVVCAAVSVLGITTANGLDSVASVKPTTAEMREGYLKIEIPLMMTQKRETAAQILLKNFKQAMQSVEAEYGEFIELLIEEGEKHA